MYLNATTERRSKSCSTAKLHRARAAQRVPQEPVNLAPLQGKAQVGDDGKTFVSAKQQRLEKKVGKEKAQAINKAKANPYKKLPVWTQ